MSADLTTTCWCGNPDRAGCCAPVLAGRPAATPEALMRARYSAYVTADTGFLLASWHPRTRPPHVHINPAQRWLGLKVRAAAVDAGNSAGTVEFVARFKIDGRGHRLHEHSRFVRENGRWLYVDGDLIEGR